jgi:hypothetical protein
MPRRSMGSFVRVLIAVAVGASFMIVGAPAWSAAYGAGQQLSTQTITEFTSNPGQVLNQFPSGGGQMISRLRDLLASDPATLAPILGLLPNANAQQKSSLGAALAQAAKLYQRADQTFAVQIQQAVANTQDQEFIVAYAAAAGDQPIGGVGAGAASGGGPGGPSNPLGSGFFATGAAQAIGGGSVDTGPFSMTASASAANNSTLNQNNGANAVSP